MTFCAVSIALALTLVSAGAPAAAEAAAEPERRDVDLTVLLDPEADAAARVAELDMLERNARAGHHPSTCTLARIAALGEKHPSEPPAFDFGDAPAWLNRCVLGGDLDAMLVMAEWELSQRRALEAMIWAQAHLKLAAALDPDSLDSAAPYKAGLLARIERRYGGDRPSNEEVLEYVAGFLANYGERIAAAYRAGGNASWPRLPGTGTPRMTSTRSTSLAGRFARDTSAARDELVYAVFVLEVDPRGKPGRILVLESWPDAAAARSLRSHPISRRYEPSEETTSRWAYLPVYLDNKAYKLRPDADPRHRPRMR